MSTDPGIVFGQGAWRVPETAEEHYVGTSPENPTLALTIGPIAREGSLDVVVEFSAQIVQLGSVDVSNREGGRNRSGDGEAFWEPPVVPAPHPTQSRIFAQAFSEPEFLQDTQPLLETHIADAPASRQRVLVGGRDITYFRGVETVVNYELLEPLLYGPASFSLPQVVSSFERLGQKPLKWLRPEARVVVQRVIDNVVVDTVYKGFIVALDTSDGNVKVEVGGEATGRAALMHRPVPIFTFTHDIGRIAWQAVKALELRFRPHTGPNTGIKMQPSGGGSVLDHITDLCAKAWTQSGAQWTIMPNANGIYRMRRKDRETIHATAFPDDVRTAASLRRDLSEEPNRIYGSGVTPKGQRVRFGAYPGLKQAKPARYPFNDGRAFGIGTTNADTDTGDGISVLVNRLTAMGYLSVDDVRGGYDQDVSDAIQALREDAEIEGLVGEDEEVDRAVWRAAFDLSVTGFSLRWSRVLPMVQRPYTKKFKRSASGAMIGKNPKYRSKRIKVDRAIEFGTGFTRPQMKKWGRAEMQREANWVGSLNLNTGAIWKGVVEPGSTPGPEDLLDATLIRPGMNIWLPLFQGGITVHVSGASVSDGTVTLAVDTQARDAMQVWEIIARNRESRSTAARLKAGMRSSTEVKDSINIWDEVGGLVDGDVALDVGWNVIPVVSGQEGSVSRLRVRMEDEIEFAVAVFGRKIGKRRLTALIGNPLSEEGTKRWQRQKISRQLQERGIIYAAGTNEEPCGYSPGTKTDKNPLRGVHLDDAGFSYRTMPGSPVLWVALWVPEETKLKAGWIMKQQLEAGV